MVTASEIRATIGEFLAGSLQFADFEDWIIAKTWNIHKHGEVEAQVLAYGVELRIAEYNLDALSLQDLRLELQNLANTFVLDPNQASRVLSASSTKVTSVPWTIQPAGTQPSTASGLPTPR
jgi:hypothetical protein